MTRWRELAAEHDVPLWEVAVQYEMDASGWPRGWVVDRMKELALVMRRQTRAVYEEDVAVIDTEFKPDFARRWMKRANAGPRKRRRHGADHQVHVQAPAPASPASRTCPGRWAAGRATSTPPSPSRRLAT